MLSKAEAIIMLNSFVPCMRHPFTSLMVPLVLTQHAAINTKPFCRDCIGRDTPWPDAPHTAPMGHEHG